MHVPQQRTGGENAHISVVDRYRGGAHGRHRRGWETCPPNAHAGRERRPAAAKTPHEGRPQIAYTGGVDAPNSDTGRCGRVTGGGHRRVEEMRSRAAQTGVGDVPTKSTGGEGETTNSGKDNGRGAPTNSIHGRSRRPQQRYRQMRERRGRRTQETGKALTRGMDIHNLCRMDIAGMCPATQSFPAFDTNVSFRIKDIYCNYVNDPRVNLSHGLCVNEWETQHG